MEPTNQTAIIAGTIDVLKNDISRTLADYDKTIGAKPEDSLALLWDRAWQVKDVNDIVQNNLRQMQVMIEDLYRTLLKDRIDHNAEIAKLKQDATESDSKERIKTMRLILSCEANFSEHQINQLKVINALVKTSRELANEIRQSAMARRFNIHISDVKKMAIAFRAVLHDRIQDVNLLCRISEDLDGVMKKIFPIKADGDY